MELDPTVWQLPAIGRPPERIGLCGVPRTLAALVWRKPWCSTQGKLRRVAKLNGSWTNTDYLKTISWLIVHCRISANQAVVKFRWAHSTPSILQPADLEHQNTCTTYAPRIHNGISGWTDVFYQPWGPWGDRCRQACPCPFKVVTFRSL